MSFRDEKVARGEFLEQENADLREKLREKRRKKMSRVGQVVSLVVWILSVFAIFWLWSYAGRMVSSASDSGVVVGLGLFGVIVVWLLFSLWRGYKLVAIKLDSQNKQNQ